jgi:HAD superfamily hydrolase (TIGR01509 family)
MGVVFDLGKVLLDFDYHRAAHAIAAQGSASPAAVFAAINAHSDLLREFETGHIRAPEFFRRAQALTGYRGSEEDFGRAFADIFTPIAPMIELQARLRSRGVPTFIFSNINELAVAHIRRTYPFFGNFTGYVFSYEQSAMKPHPRIYEAVERHAGVPAERLIYIDDRPENIEEGRRRGWQAICHVDCGDTIARVEGSGVL